jgi:hypothetical protein
MLRTFKKRLRHFTLLATGQYTIGVFRISLVEPAKVEPTVFQLRGTTTE